MNKLIILLSAFVNKAGDYEKVDYSLTMMNN